MDDDVFFTGDEDLMENTMVSGEGKGSSSSMTPPLRTRAFSFPFSVADVRFAIHSPAQHIPAAVTLRRHFFTTADRATSTSSSRTSGTLDGYDNGYDDEIGMWRVTRTLM